jgi:hypothetical protein
LHAAEVGWYAAGLGAAPTYQMKTTLLQGEAIPDCAGVYPSGPGDVFWIVTSPPNDADT